MMLSLCGDPSHHVLEFALIASQRSSCYNAHLTDEETEAQRLQIQLF